MPTPTLNQARSILLISCPADQHNLLRDISDFIAMKNGYVTSMQQLVEKEDNQLFMRIKWASNKLDACDISVSKDFKWIAEKYDIEYEFTCSTQRLKLGLFTSKTTHCLEKVLYEHSEGNLEVDIPLVISNSELSRKTAERYGIPFFYISTKQENYEDAQIELLKKHEIDVIGLARYMKVLSPKFVDQYKHKIINIHHSFLPSFVGANPYQEAYRKGVKLIGATSHFVIADLDQGPIIQQDVSRVHEGFDAESLTKQGREVEASVFYFALEKYIQKKLWIHKNRVIVFT